MKPENASSCSRPNGEAQWLLSRLKERPRKRRKTPWLPLKVPLASLDKRTERREAMASLREKVFERATPARWENPICELGPCPGCTDEGFYAATDLDHLEGGSERRSKQWEGNCVAVCRACHRRRTDHPEEFYERIVDWAARWKYPVPPRVQRSHDKYLRTLKGETP